MGDEERQNRDDFGNSSSYNMMHYIAEPALFISFITACLYFVGYGYYLSFFSRFSVQTRLMNIGTINYITEAFTPILFLGSFIAIFFLVGSHIPRNRTEAFLGNLLFIIIFAFYILLTKTISKNHLSISIVTVLGLFFILSLIYLSYKKFSVAYFYYSSGFYIKFFVLIMLVLGLFNIAGFFGFNHAENLIQGKIDRLEIQLFMKDKTNTQLQDKSFIFIMLHDNKYYVVDENETISKYPKLYIIPTDEVEMATVYTVSHNSSKEDWLSLLN